MSRCFIAVYLYSYWILYSPPTRAKEVIHRSPSGSGFFSPCIISPYSDSR